MLSVYNYLDSGSSGEGLEANDRVNVIVAARMDLIKVA